MANYTWPTTLPQTPRQSGFSEVGGVNVLRTPMDAGPAKLRRRSKLAKPMDLVFDMTTTQVAALENFIENTLFGVRRFNWVHPRTLSAIEVRIIPGGDGEFFKLSSVGGRHWQVSLQMEVLP